MKFLTISFYAGIALLLLCIAILVTPLGKRFSEKTQKIQGFGLNLEVSVLTLLVLISVALLTSGIWFQLQDVSRQIKQLEEDKKKAEQDYKRAQEQLENAQQLSLIAFAKLDGVNDVSQIKSDIQAFSCSYTNTAGEDEKCRLELSEGLNKVKIVFLDLRRDTIVRSVTVTNTRTHEKWVHREEHRWLQPEITLTKEPSAPQ